MEITIGTDPEVFLQTHEGVFVSAHDLIPGSKQMPHMVMNGAIQPDGVAAEFNTMPARTSDEFITNITLVMDQLEAEFKKIRPDLMIAIQPTATFDGDYFKTLPEVAVALGCTPDFNAYTGEENQPPSTNETFRTGAGHIHVGWGRALRGPSHFDLCRDMVKQLDTILYPASLLWDDDNKRRTLYGKIGAFRNKSYGVEYRPLSNAYLTSKETQKFVFDATMHCADLYLNKGVKLFENTIAQDMVGAIQADVPLSSNDIHHYLHYMHDTFGTKVY